MEIFHQFLAILFGGWLLTFVLAAAFFPRASVVIVNIIGIVVGFLMTWLSLDTTTDPEDEEQ